MNDAQVSQLLKALGDETRMLIVALLLMQGETCACRFLDNVNCGQATLSHHLAILSKANLVRVRKDGIRRLYTANHDLYDELVAYMQSIKK